MLIKEITERTRHIYFFDWNVAKSTVQHFMLLGMPQEVSINLILLLKYNLILKPSNKYNEPPKIQISNNKIQYYFLKNKLHVFCTSGQADDYNAYRRFSLHFLYD